MSAAALTSNARRLCLVLAAVIVFQLFYLGSQPIAVGLFQEPWDKVAHFVVYGALTALLWLGTADRMRFIMVFAGIALGACDEIHQMYLPGRVADVRDFLADAAGSLTAAAMMYFHTRSSVSQ